MRGVTGIDEAQIPPRDQELPASTTLLTRCMEHQMVTEFMAQSKGDIFFFFFFLLFFRSIPYNDRSSIESRYAKAILKGEMNICILVL